MASTRLEDVSVEQRSHSKSTAIVKLVALLAVLAGAFLSVMYGVSLLIS
jgi:hypothetical protein